MKPQFRIRNTPKGFLCEYKEKPSFLWWPSVWKPYLTYTGLDEPYYFSSMESAIEKLKWEVWYYCERYERF